MTRIAVFCASDNIEMTRLFREKTKAFSSNILFYSGRRLRAYIMQNDPSSKVKMGSFNESQNINFFLFLDLFYHFFLALYLRLSGVRWIVFDSAHISNIALAVYFKLLGGKLIFTIHDWEPHPGQKQYSVRVYNFAVKRYLADRFITFSEVDSTKPVDVLSLGGFEVNFQEEYRKNKTCLFFGRIEPYKGLKHLSRIIDISNSSDKGYRYIVAGSGFDPELDEIDSKENVRLINRFIPNAELDSLLREADCVILPYDSATQSGVVLHAFSYGIPVVAFNTGALKEYIDNGVTGVLVDQFDYDAFVNSIEEINNNYEVFVSNIKSVYNSRYSLDAFLNQYSILFGKLELY